MPARASASCTLRTPPPGGGRSQVERHRAGDGAAVDEHHGLGGNRRALAVRIHRPDPMHLELRRAPVELSVWHEPGRHSEAQPVMLSGDAGRHLVAALPLLRLVSFRPHRTRSFPYWWFPGCLVSGISRQAEGPPLTWYWLRCPPAPLVALCRGPQAESFLLATISLCSFLRGGP